MSNKEIQEIIIACVDYVAENEKYSKDIMKEIYQYIDKHYNNNIDEEKLYELAKAAEMELVSNCPHNPIDWPYIKGFMTGYRKAIEE